MLSSHTTSILRYLYLHTYNSVHETYCRDRDVISVRNVHMLWLHTTTFIVLHQANVRTDSTQSTNAQCPHKAQLPRWQYLIRQPKELLLWDDCESLWIILRDGAWLLLRSTEVNNSPPYRRAQYVDIMWVKYMWYACLTSMFGIVGSSTTGSAW